MPVAQSLEADDNGPATKKAKTGTEDEFPYGTRVAILQSCGKSVCHVPTSEIEKIFSDTSTTYTCGDSFAGTDIEVHDFRAEEHVIKFLAHWIYHRDSEEAIKVTMNRQTERRSGVLDGEWLTFLIKAMNFFNDPVLFTNDITGSLVDSFLWFLSCGGLDHIEQILEVYRDHCKTGPWPASSSTSSSIVRSSLSSRYPQAILIELSRNICVVG
ncbi:hypothetical protein KCU78_g9596, partial [Aureobasidium melanogenum]